jgi:hypothetical protein
VVNGLLLTGCFTYINLQIVPTYNEILSTLRQNVEHMVAEHAAIGKKITSLMKAIEAVQALAAEEELVIQPPTMPPEMEAGFTDRVRNILKANPFRPLTAVEVRDVLLKETPKDDPKVTLIHAHNTLKRLKSQDEVDESDAPEGRKAYRIKSPYSSLASLVLENSGFAGAVGTLMATPPPKTSLEDAISTLIHEPKEKNKAK